MSKVAGRANVNAEVGNALQIGKENCKCEGTTMQKCTYTAEVEAQVSSVTFDGEALDLPRAPYAVTSDGASKLEEDLKDRVVADDITVTYAANGSDPDSLTVVVTGTFAELNLVNAVAASSSACFDAI